MRLAPIFLLLTALAYAAPEALRTDSGVVIPRISKAPTLEDFAGMKPNAEWQGRLAVVDSFLQRDPKDGAPATSKTAAYMGYDDKNLYVIFVCFDDQPNSVRSRLARRDT